MLHVVGVAGITGFSAKPKAHPAPRHSSDSKNDLIVAVHQELTTCSGKSPYGVIRKEEKKFYAIPPFSTEHEKWNSYHRTKSNGEKRPLGVHLPRKL